MNISRIPKGHRVICAMPHHYKPYITDQGIQCKEDDDKIYIEGFVSGDDPNIGLSIVALDNPEYCIYFANVHIRGDGPIIRAQRRIDAQNGFMNQWLRLGGLSTGIIHCPY